MDTRVWEDWVKAQGYSRIVGVDEVGRGPLAGPVVACACHLPVQHGIVGIKDSKKLTEAQRDLVSCALMSCPVVSYGIGVVECEEIDSLNILRATFKAMNLALLALDSAPEFVLVDGHLMIPNLQWPQKCLIGGDALSETIAAASVIAKVHRDALMKKYHKQYPEYGFESNKGYGTKGHLEALRKLGPCPQHRLSFAPVKNWDASIPVQLTLFEEKNGL